MQDRECKLGAVVGKKGVGKSFTTDRIIKQYVMGDPANGIAPRRFLILDVNDEYSHIDAIDPKQVRIFSAQRTIEVRRIRPFRPDGKKQKISEILETALYVLENYRQGGLLMEDINRYVSDNLPSDLTGAICTNRHTATDIIMHFQSIGRITPKIWQNLNWLRFHKNTDSVGRHKLKYPDKIELLTLAETIVNEEYFGFNSPKGARLPNERYYCYVDVEMEKIQGSVDPFLKEFAVDNYINENYSALINPLLKHMDSTGNKKYTAQTAFAVVKDRLLKTYF